MSLNWSTQKSVKAMAEKGLHFSDHTHTHLVAAFLAMEPTDCLLSLSRACGKGSITEEVQRFIWDHCISKDDGNFHGPYLKKFLKKLIVEVESTGADVLDELYEQYAIFMTSLKDDDMAKRNSRILKLVSFLYPDDCFGSKKLVIPLQFSLNLLEGGTGCSIWPSSLFLSEFILSFPEIFSGKSCFEVGSGVGLVGICLAHVRASKVILSDGDLSSLANMKLNLDLNQLNMNTGLLEPTRQNKILVDCMYLPWESAPESELRGLMADVILGADVLYDPLYIPHLIRVLAIILCQQKTDSDHTLDNEKILHNGKITGAHEERHILEGHLEETGSRDHTSLCTSINSSRYWHQASKKGPVAYIASVIRNIDTFNCFLTLAEQADLTVTDLSGEIQVLDLLPYMKSYQRSDVKLFSVSSSCFSE